MSQDTTRIPANNDKYAPVRMVVLVTDTNQYKQFKQDIKEGYNERVNVLLHLPI